MSWFEETLHKDWSQQGYTQRFKIEKLLYEGHSDFQHFLVFETPHFGRVLVLDGVIQLTEKDEYAYHEMLAHVPLFAHRRVSTVLIIGGGDGCVLREVLLHKSVEEVTLVELDSHVVDVSKKYFKKVNSHSFDDHRTNLKIQDGQTFLESCVEKFDLIIIDSTDPIGPGERLFSEKFYTLCSLRLKANGILVNQSGVPFFQEKQLSQTHKLLRNIFQEVGVYLTVVPSYVGGFFAICLSSNVEGYLTTEQATIQKRFKSAKLTTQYYSPEIHKAAFIIPDTITKTLLL